MLRRLLFLNIMFSLFIALLPNSVAQADCDFTFSNYARAVMLHDMGDYGRALQHYHCAQLEDPDDAIIPILIENVYEDIANAASAWSRPESAASATVCDPAIDHAQLGAEAHDAGDENLALIHLHCVLLGDPAQVDALYRMGMIHINLGDTHEAKHYFDRADRAAAAQVEDEDLLIHLLGEAARSVLDIDSLADLSLTSPDPGATGEYLPRGLRQQEGILYLNPARHVNPRVDELKRALKQDPTRVDLRCELGRRYMAQGEYAAAFVQFSYLIRERLDSYCNSASRGRALAPTAPPDAPDLAQALKQDPMRIDLRCELGRQYMVQGDYAAAFGQFFYLIRERLGDHCQGDGQEWMAPSPTPPVSDNASIARARVSPAEGQIAEGMRYMAAGNLYVAANTFLLALDLDPLHLDARCRLGMIYTEWAHYRGALEQFEIILQQDPENICARQNRTIAARDMLAIFTPLVVDDYFHYARIYVGMEEWELALDAFRKGLDIDPTRSEVRCELGMLYAQLGEDRAALNEFDLALFADDLDSCARANRDALLQRLRDG